jgi:hypothetical protein
MVKTDKYIFFYGGIYSNWYPAEFTIDGILYENSEKYFIAKKALTFNDLEAYDKIMKISDPREIKAIGRTVNGFNKEVWEKVCRKIMYDANYAKFTQNEELLEELLSTGNLSLVECSPVDKIWGIGLAESDDRIYDESKWDGLNYLGICLTELCNDLSKNLTPKLTTLKLKTITHNNRVFNLNTEVEFKITENNKNIVVLHNEVLDIYSHGKTMDEAITDLSEYFDYTYHHLARLDDYSLSKHLRTAKHYINSIVESITEIKI